MSINFSMPTELVRATHVCAARHGTGCNKLIRDGLARLARNRSESLEQADEAMEDRLS